MKNYYNMTPKEIVAELDKYIIGQESAKKSVAVALRNRYRRNLLSPEMREEVTPKNILMIGPTGCGKTEIARRLAKIMDAPFVKVEATKFTEVGYVGRDVDSIIRDLVEASIRLTKHNKMQEKYGIADEIVENKIVDAIMPKKHKPSKRDSIPGQSDNPFAFLSNIPGVSTYFNQPMQQPEEVEVVDEEQESGYQLAKEQIKKQLKDGLLEDQMIEIDVEDTKGNTIDLGGNENMSISIGSIFGDMVPKKMKKRKVKVRLIETQSNGGNKFKYINNCRQM